MAAVAALCYSIYQAFKFYSAESQKAKLAKSIEELEEEIAMHSEKLKGVKPGPMHHHGPLMEEEVDTELKSLLTISSANGEEKGTVGDEVSKPTKGTKKSE